MGRIPAQRFTTWTSFALFSIFWLFTVSGVRGQSNYQTIYSFGNIDPSGSVPKASLIVGGDGMLYGTTSAGGTNGLGCVFKMNRDGSGYSELHDFAGVGGDGAQPVAALLLGMDGALYGMTSAGGYSGSGQIFKLQADGSGFQTLWEFDGSTNGGNPVAGLIQTPDGTLFGATYAGGSNNLGTIFSIGPDGNGFQQLRSFSGTGGDGAHPRSALLLGEDGAIYGTTQSGGSSSNGIAFAMNRDGSGFSVLHNFGTASGEGAEPYGSLYQGTNGMLFGTTLHGGPSTLAQGTVFTVNTNGQAYSVLKSFSGTGTAANPYGALILGTNGMLFGITCNGGTTNMGTVFRMNLNASGYTILKSFTGTDGSFPLAGLVMTSDGTLYGTTSLGGGGLSGTVFTINEDGSGFADLRQMAGGEGDGAFPRAPLLQATNGTLYGTTYSRDGDTAGCVYSINPDGSGYAVLKRFTGFLGDGANPWSPLVQASNGILYGTTTYGGTNNIGIIFRINLDGTGYQLLDYFISASRGAYPVAGLIQGMDGGLYGTAVRGGVSSFGTVFRVNTDGSSFTVFKNFSNSTSDGGVPYAGLLQGPDGTLYGTTTSGGTYGLGTVFKVNTNGTGFALLVSFSGQAGDGAIPYGALMLGSDGALYGTTTSGGANSGGTAFRLNTDGSGYTTLAALPAELGSPNNSFAQLVQDPSGALFGTTLSGGSGGSGTVFRLTPNGSTFFVLKEFSGSPPDGALPYAGLARASNGLMYGTTVSGGMFDHGVVFSIVPPAAMMHTALTLGVVQIQFVGVPARSYSVQRAPSPSGPWTTLGAAIPDSTGLGQFQDSNPPPGNNFYRTSVP